jgi:hypothetical protein
MYWKDVLKSDPLPWLLQDEPPGAAYLTYKCLLEDELATAQAERARQAAYQDGAIGIILSHMQPEGYWEEPGPGYNPKYRSTVWSLIALAQLGARLPDDERIATACGYLLEHSLSEVGSFSASGAPGATVDCLHGNLLAALLDLGYSHPRLGEAFDWMARSVTGDGIAPLGAKDTPRRYYAGKCGPNFACGANNKLPCAWGAVKVMLAFGRLPVEKRTPQIEAAIRQGVEFLLGVDPATAAYPAGWAEKPSGNWWKFGFPVFYVTDILQIVEALALLGYGGDPRLANALALVVSKQDNQGRWMLEYDYRGKTWAEFGDKKQPNTWVTLRALRALRLAYP